MDRRAALICIAELSACRLTGCRHYPPSWVEALPSLGSVVIGSATPVGASQWSFCRTGSRALCPAPGDFLDPRQKRGQDL